MARSGLRFADEHALRAALRLVPPTVQEEGGSVARGADGSLTVVARLPAELRDVLVRAGAEAVPARAGRPFLHWAELVPLERDDDPDLREVLFVLPPGTPSLPLAAELVRLGCDAQELADLGDEGVAIRARRPPYYTVARAPDAEWTVYARQGPAWVEVGWRHPLAGRLAVPDGAVLLVSPQDVWSRRSWPPTGAAWSGSSPGRPPGTVPSCTSCSRRGARRSSASGTATRWSPCRTPRTSGRWRRRRTCRCPSTGSRTATARGPRSGRRGTRRRWRRTGSSRSAGGSTRWACATPSASSGLREHLDGIEALRAELPPHVYLWVNAFQRVAGYATEAERDRIRAVDPRFDDNRAHASLGRACRAGHTHFTVDGDGAVRRCHFVEGEVLGNLYDGDLDRLLRPRTCPNATCRCHIGYVHLENIDLYRAYGDGLMARIPEGT